MHLKRGIGGMRVNDYTTIVIFDREYPMEKQAEGIAVNQAVLTGACNQCGFLARCSTDDSFKPPVFAWCAKKKAEILANWNEGG